MCNGPPRRRRSWKEHTRLTPDASAAASSVRCMLRMALLLSLPDGQGRLRVAEPLTLPRLPNLRAGVEHQEPQAQPARAPGDGQAGLPAAHDATSSRSMSAILPRTTPAQARTVDQRMHAALATPIAVADHTFHVQASVGISAAGRPGMNTATLLQEADTAMYRAKKTRADTAVAARDWPLPYHHAHRDDLARRRA
jgi:hypothetical protein